MTQLQFRPIEFFAIEFFANAPPYKNANVANFMLAVALEKNYINEVYNLEMLFSHTYLHSISHLLASKCSINRVNCKCTENKDGNNANIANFV